MLDVLAGAFIISFAPVFVQLANVGPTTAVFYRFLFGFVALSAAALLSREKLWTGRATCGWALAAGTVFATDLFFWHRSIHWAGPGLATILANFQVFVLATIGVLFMGERLSWRLVVAIPVALAGLFLLVGMDWSTLGHRYQWGIVCGLITAVCYAALALILRKSQSRPAALGPVANMAWVSMFGAALISLGVWPSGETFYVPDSRTWISLIAYGALCSGFGWSLISRGLPKIRASQAGLALILQPTLAFVWDIVIFGRPTTTLQLAGAAITLGAIYLGSKQTR